MFNINLDIIKKYDKPGPRYTSYPTAPQFNESFKAEHFLDATLYLNEGGFTDVAVTQAFYVMYHSFLAVLAQQGYESRNQTCTFAAVGSLIGQGKLKLDPLGVRRVAAYDEEGTAKGDVISLREEFQYGVQTQVDGKKLGIVIAEAKGLLETVKRLLVG